MKRSHGGRSEYTAGPGSKRGDRSGRLNLTLRRGGLAGSRTDGGSQELGTGSSVHDADSSE